MKISSKFSLALLAGTILSTPAMAAEEKEITVDYLNSLTGPKVTWSETQGDYEINLTGKTWYYDYNKPTEFEMVTAEPKDFEFNGSSGNINRLGGGVINNPADTNYGNIESKVFANNKVTGSISWGYGNRNHLYLCGGVIYNIGEIGDINADFINNSVEATAQGENNDAKAYGGAIYNDYNEQYAIIENITGDFIGNYATSINDGAFDEAYGGAIVNGGIIGSITGDFIGNYVQAKSGQSFGGAILNGGTIGDITGDFIGNYAQSTDAAAYGGAIVNQLGNFNITGDFIGNYAQSTNSDAYGGAIYNYEGTIGNITGDFIGNYVQSESANVAGGAIVGMIIGEITGNIVNNHAQNKSGVAYGGAISGMITGSITGNIVNNYIISETAIVVGGAIDNQSGILHITGNIMNNYAQSEKGTAYGGAIASTIGLDMNTMEVTAPSVSSKGQDIFLSGNYTEDTRGKIYNALHVMILPEEDKQDFNIPADAVDFAFDTSGGGSITINDNIDGSMMDDNGMTDDRSAQYNLAFRGDDVLNDDGRTTQYIAINNDIINAGKVTVEGTTLHFGSYQHEDEKAVNWKGQGAFVPGEGTDAVTSLSLTNAALDIYNGYMDKVNLKGWSASNSYLHVDVDVAAGTADVLNIAGDVVGQTKVIVYADSEEVTDKSILFATATGNGAEESFTVYRVYNSPYMFDVAYNPDGENGKEWSLTMTDEENEFAGVKPGEQPDPEVPDVDVPDIDIPDVDITVPTAPVYGEVVAYGALPAAALEQTRNMVDNVGGQVAATRTQDAAANYNLWVNPTYYTSNIDSPFAIDADIWGIEAGGDIQRDIHNRLGVFFSYRQGEYDMNGNGDKYRSPVGSEIDIDSYLAGLYYRYDNKNLYAFATLYGGIQEADIKTDDGMKSDTDGVEFGASVEAGYDYALTDSVTLTPELGVFYTQVNYDDASDNVGKSASYDDARQIELEAGVKLAKTFMTDESFANVYVKPSVVQTIVDGEDVSITGLGDVEALDDATLGRIEIGGRYGLTTNLSAYGWANYTFGSDYDATTFGLGLNYAF